MRTATRKRRTRLIVLSIVLIAFLTIAGGIAGFVAGQVRTPQYTSVANLIWDPSALRYGDSSAYVPDSVSLALQVEGQTERVMSDAVIVPVAEQLGTSVRELRTVVSASVGDGSTLINIEADASTPARAQEIAAAVVASYTASVASALTTQYTAQSAAVASTIDRLEDELASATPDSALESSLASQLVDLGAQQEQLDAKAASPATPLSSLQEASLPEEPSTPSATTLAIVGAGFGFLIGAGIVALARLRRRATEVPLERELVVQSPAERARHELAE